MLDFGKRARSQRERPASECIGVDRSRRTALRRPWFGPPGLALTIATFAVTTCLALGASSPLGQPDRPPRAPAKAGPAKAPTPRPSPAPAQPSVPRVRVAPTVRLPKTPTTTPRTTTKAPTPKPTRKPRVTVTRPPKTVTTTAPAATTTATTPPASTTPTSNPSIPVAASSSTSKRAWRTILPGGLLLLAALAAMVAALPLALERTASDRDGVLAQLSTFWPESAALFAATGSLALLMLVT